MVDGPKYNGILVYICLFLFDCETNIFTYLKHIWIRSWIQPVLSNEGTVSFPRTQRTIHGIRIHDLPIASRMLYLRDTPPKLLTYNFNR